VYFVWKVVKTPTIILNNPVYCFTPPQGNEEEAWTTCGSQSNELKGFIWPWVVSSVVGESCEDDYELSDYIKNNKRWVCYYQLPQGGVHNLASCFYSQIYPITCLRRPLGLQEIEVPGFLDNRNMNVVRPSALLAGRLYPHSPRISPSYLFLLETECAPGP